MGKCLPLTASDNLHLEIVGSMYVSTNLLSSAKEKALKREDNCVNGKGVA